MSEVTEEQWHVQIEAGDVRLWTLDQLDAAFKAELVDESTFVLEVGQTEWMQLGTLLGGGDEVDAPEAALPPVSPVGVAPAAISFAPAAPVVAPVMLADAASLGPYSTSSPYSTAPMAADVDDDLESPSSFRGSKKRPVAIFVGVALLAAGVAVFASVRGGLTTAVPAPEVAAAAAPAAAPEPVTPTPAADSQAAAAGTSLSARLTQDQLQKLSDADKVREAKLSAQRAHAAALAPHHSGGGHKTKEKGPFHSGGDKYDPLNAKL